MIIREFNGTVKDAAGIRRVDDLTFNDMTLSDEDLIIRLAALENKAFVAVDDFDEVVGFVSVIRAQTLHGIGLWIDLIAVRPNDQNQGIAGQLVHRALSYG